MIAGQREAGEEGGDAPLLADVGKAQQRTVDFRLHAPEGRDRIDHHRRWIELQDVAVHAREVHFQAVQAGPGGLEHEQSALDVLLQIDPGRAHVAHDLVRGFLESEVQAPFAPLADRVGEPGAEGRLAGPRKARQQDAGAAIETAPGEHGVEVRDAGRRDLGRDLMLQGRRGDRHDADPTAVDQERVLVGPV